MATRLKRVDNARIGYLRTLFETYVDDPDKIEARSTLAFTLAIGHHFMAADHDGPTEREALSLAGVFVLRPPNP